MIKSKQVFLKVASENSISEEGDENLRNQLEVLSESKLYHEIVLTCRDVNLSDFLWFQIFSLNRILRELELT